MGSATTSNFRHSILAQHYALQPLVQLLCRSKVQIRYLRGNMRFYAAPCITNLSSNQLWAAVVERGVVGSCGLTPTRALWCSTAAMWTMWGIVGITWHDDTNERGHEGASSLCCIIECIYLTPKKVYRVVCFAGVLKQQFAVGVILCVRFCGGTGRSVVKTRRPNNSTTWLCVPPIN